MNGIFLRLGLRMVKRFATTILDFLPIIHQFLRICHNPFVDLRPVLVGSNNVSERDGLREGGRGISTKRRK